MKPKARMSDTQFKATTAELVRLTLGGKPERPELLDWRRFARADLLRAVGRKVRGFRR